MTLEIYLFSFSSEVEVVQSLSQFYCMAFHGRRAVRLQSVSFRDVSEMGALQRALLLAAVTVGIRTPLMVAP